MTEHPQKTNTKENTNVEKPNSDECRGKNRLPMNSDIKTFQNRRQKIADNMKRCTEANASLEKKAKWSELQSM